MKEVMYVKPFLSKKRCIFEVNAQLSINQRDIFQHVPIIFQKPVKPDSMGVPGFSPFGDVHMSFRIPPRLDARE